MLQKGGRARSSHRPFPGFSAEQTGTGEGEGGGLIGYQMAWHWQTGKAK